MTAEENKARLGLPDIEMLDQPLLTDEGFLNEACMKELAGAIASMPETYDRLKDDPEWSTPWGTTCTGVLEAFAHSSIGAFCGQIPPDFYVVFLFLRACLVRDYFPECSSDDIDFRWREMSLCEINKALWDILGELAAFRTWNDSEVLPETWVSTSALLHNVCNEIRWGRRRDVAFELRFEREQSDV